MSYSRTSKPDKLTSNGLGRHAAKNKGTSELKNDGKQNRGPQAAKGDDTNQLVSTGLDSASHQHRVNDPERKAGASGQAQRKHAFCARKE
jgi:hypothetical protein